MNETASDLGTTSAGNQAFAATQCLREGVLEEKTVLQRALMSPSTIEIASKWVLLFSACLYSVGLIVVNFNAQRFGISTLSIADSRYILVGLLWLALTLFTSALARSAIRLIRHYGPWNNRSLKANLLNVLRLSFWCLCLLGFYIQVVSFLSSEGASVFAFIEVPRSLQIALVVIGVMLLTVLSFGALFEDTVREMKERAAPHDGFLTKLWKADYLQISKRVFYVLMSLGAYATFVYPHLSPAFGGGKLHQAHIVIRQSDRSAFDAIKEFSIDKSGLLCPVEIVSESDQYFVVALPSRQIVDLSHHSLMIKKDLVELVLRDK